jgi:hypothetical protein
MQHVSQFVVLAAVALAALPSACHALQLAQAVQAASGVARRVSSGAWFVAALADPATTRLEVISSFGVTSEMFPSAPIVVSRNVTVAGTLPDSTDWPLVRFAPSFATVWARDVCFPVHFVRLCSRTWPMTSMCSWTWASFGERCAARLRTAQQLRVNASVEL